MPLKIETFSNIHGGNAFFKAISHPLMAPKVGAYLERIAGQRVAIYDPLVQVEAFAQFHDLSSVNLVGYYVQDIETLGRSYAGQAAQLVTEISNSGAQHVCVMAFDSAKMVDHIRHLLPAGVNVISLDDLRLPADMVTDKSRYLSGMNFATNFVFFRDMGGQHTRLVSANYWGGYGAKEVTFWCRLFDGAGKELITWQEKMGAAQSTFILDSADIRARFKLPEFIGQLFIHAIGVAGHDIVKYALDTYGDTNSILSCTHDANSWPSDFYAGLPAPDKGEEVVLWLQNSQPFPIPAGEIGLNLMGSDKVVRLNEVVAPFATRRLSVTELLPDAVWPQQVEVVAGKYMVRPRYEVVANNGRVRIAHVNVERSDLKPDPKLAEIGAYMGKGHILPAPILPTSRFACFMLPTPMARGQNNLPLKALIYDGSGASVAEYRFGNLSRNHAHLLDVGAVLAKAGAELRSGFGHAEILYDFEAGKEADGWLHGLFRYVDIKNGHAAESSFGSHMFNSVLTYKNEPQSYIGRAPGLSTRLFLRIGQKPYDTLCHLIYPASTPWHGYSDTSLILTSKDGKEIAQAKLKIPCSGSHFWRVSETFNAKQLDDAGEGGYVIIRDTTCRLFGYHGLMHGDESFSLDHMFGF